MSLTDQDCTIIQGKLDEYSIDATSLVSSAAKVCLSLSNPVFQVLTESAISNPCGCQIDHPGDATAIAHSNATLTLLTEIRKEKHAFGRALERSLTDSKAESESSSEAQKARLFLDIGTHLLDCNLRYFTDLV